MKAIVSVMYGVRVFLVAVVSAVPLQRSPRQKQYSVSCLLVMVGRANIAIKI